MKRTVLFVCSSPLHSLWALALAAGPFADARRVLWAFEPGGDQPDFIVEALRANGLGPFSEIETTGTLTRDDEPDTRLIRTALRQMQDRARAIAPDVILAGNDRTRQFQAIAVAVRGAAVTYMDDGTGSYVPLPALKPSIGRTLKRWRNLVRRRFRYGFSYDKPRQLGMTRRVKAAWVAFPEHVHPGLRTKTLHRLEAGWLREESTRRICRDAVRLAGLDPERLAGLDLLLLLPRDSQIDETPGLRAQLESIARDVIARGGRLAIKRHPRSSAMTLAIDPQSCIDIPPRLPVEILAPLLSRVRVVGALTSALIYLPWLGAEVSVEAIVPAGAEEHPVVQFYRALGIPAFRAPE